MSGLGTCRGQSANTGHITLREAALLQSFPPSHSFRLDGGKYRTAKKIGNAPPPRFVTKVRARV